MHWAGVAAGYCYAVAAAAATAKLPAGTVVKLELQQTITSAYTPADSPIYFRVRDDILADGAVVIRRGTLVTGRMAQSDGRHMMAVSGSMSFGVRFVPAVDGQQIRVIATQSMAGRDRGDALTGWTIFWGLGGLMTHGVNAYMERGAVMEGQILSDKRIDLERAAAPTEAPPPTQYRVDITRHRFDASTAKVLALNLEGDRKLGKAAFELRPDAGLGTAGFDSARLQLVSVDGATLPEPVPALDATGPAVRFDAWSILQYCHDGENMLGFRAELASGSSVDATDTVSVKFNRKH
jgi:hypothetical protein